MAPDHVERSAVINELHARPSPLLRATATAVHIALKEPHAVARDRSADERQLADLFAAHEQPFAATSPGTGHVRGRLGDFDLHWENHSEMVTYTAYRTQRDAEPFTGRPDDLFPPSWLAAHSPQRLAAVVVEVVPMPSDPSVLPEQVSERFDASSTVISGVLGGHALITGDFRTDQDGWMRFCLFVDDTVGPARTGRTVQRLLDLETYRAMAMLGFRVSQQLSRRLAEVDPELVRLMDGLEDPDRRPEDALDDLLHISTDLETLAMRYDYRFGATHAYDAIVTDRLRNLRETRFMERQTLGEFLDRRYRPAIRTVASAEARLGRMIARVTRAGELLRTRVDVDLARQNTRLLSSMDHRSDVQFRLQRTVEGLSVVAISYYAAQLLAYVLAPLAEQAGLSKTVLMAILVPMVVVVSWWGLSRIKKAIPH